MERLLKINEVSEMLQMSPKTIYHWVHCGSIPYFKVYRERGSAGVIRFRQSDLEKWLQVRRQKIASVGLTNTHSCSLLCSSQ